jgi:membrane-associated phospholipid phosphatase
VAADFVKNGYLAQIDCPKWDPAHTAAEVAALVSEVTLSNRDKRMAQIIAQADNALEYWAGMFGFAPGSHPATFRIMCACTRVGELIAMHFKAIHKRARPSHVSPSVQPPFDPPGHASYPSGHATQSTLIALCLADVMPADAKPALLRLGDRIGRNRELGGFHFKSDTDAGNKCARDAHPLLRKCATYQPLETAARSEWS